jgi:hypothetical protein
METAKKLDEIFKDSNDINITLMGKAGSGKSSIINKISLFSDKNEKINFPFVDTSRTTTFAADYIFTSLPESGLYKCAVFFMPNEIIGLRVDECLERAINKAIEVHVSAGNRLENSKLSAQDSIIRSFHKDPSLLFDIKLCFGNHIKTNSQNYNKEENKNIVARWARIANECILIAKTVVAQSLSDDADPSFYEEKFSNAMKSNVPTNKVLSMYRLLKEYIEEELSEARKRIFKIIEANKAVTNFKSYDNYFICNIIYNSINDVAQFVDCFATKSNSVFGSSLLPLVHRLRIELPYNSLISEDIRSLRICFHDTVGVAHAAERSGGFEHSTSLSMKNVDAVIITDDSRLNMDNNTGIILSHIASRIDYKKIYFALTFFDDFTKAEFDHDEDAEYLDEQKKDYLSSIQRERVIEYLRGNDASKLLNKRLESEENTFYLKGLAQNTDTDFASIDVMLKQIWRDAMISKSPLGVSPKNKNEAIVVYDYRKLSLHYAIARNEYINEQRQIYLHNYPHFKTTEALTRRLQKKEKVFLGAVNLTPVDDLYHILIRELDSYILAPKKINLVGESENIRRVLEKIKTIITESIKTTVEGRFFTPTNLYTWNSLYSDGGTGVDQRRRKGIMSTEELIAQSETDFISQANNRHFIDELEEIFVSSVQKVENEIIGAKKG